MKCSQVPLPQASQAKNALSASVLPPSMHSSVSMRQPTTMSRPTAARTRVHTSRRQPHASLEIAAIAIRPVVQARQERGHGVRMRIMKLHAVKSRAPCALGCVRKKCRQHPWQLFDMRLLDISHALAKALLQGLQFASCQHIGERTRIETREPAANVGFRRCSAPNAARCAGVMAR